MLSPSELGAVARVLQDVGEPVAGPIGAQLITGGRSNLTFLLTDGVRRWVMRMPPRSGRTPSAHDVGREYRVTQRLQHTDVPVPPAVALCEDESIIGAPFAIAGYVNGRTVQTRADLEALDDDVVWAVARRLVETLAALHRLDYRAIGLAGLGRPDGYAQRQVKRWSGQWEIVGLAEHHRLATEMHHRLVAALPEQGTSSIVHGDYRVDNTILAMGSESADQPSIAAVVDWELSTLGDPVADVAMMCAYRNPGLDLVLGAPAAWSSPRLPDVTTLAGLYESAGGARLAHWEFHLALAYYKIAVVSAGIHHRLRAVDDPGQPPDSLREAVQYYLDLARAALGPRQ